VSSTPPTRAVTTAEATARELNRLRGPDRSDGDPRSPFARDYDRLLFTPSFRRLQGKTQVVTPGEADFFRTRLTHTLEVAQGARRLAELLNRQADHARLSYDVGPGVTLSDEDVVELPADCQRIDPDLCEAVAVLHDLGHPPYGHLGEQALAEELREHTGAGKAVERDVSFNANAQSFRLAVRTLRHKSEVAGLQLTRAVLDGALKYPVVYDDDVGRWSVEPSETADFQWVRADVPEHLKGEQTLEAQVVDLADDVAYVQHDLDDWYRAGYMPLAELAVNREMQRSLRDWVLAKWERRGRVPDEFTPADVRDAFHMLFEPEQPFGSFAVAVRQSSNVWDPRSTDAREAFQVMRSLLFDDVFDPKHVRIVERDGAQKAPRRYRFALHVERDIRLRHDLLKELLWRYVVSDVRLATQQFGQRRAMRALTHDHVTAAISEDEESWNVFPLEDRDRLRNAADTEGRLRVAVDFISALTDAGAHERYARLGGAGAGLHSYG
jgi:dGTPase